MKLARALKLKKKLAGEIAKLQQLINTENLQVDTNKSRFDVKDLLNDLFVKQEKLVAVKTQIAQANSAIWSRIFLITEFKGRITFLRGINTQEGSFSEVSYRETINKTFTPQVNKAEIEEMVKRLETEIESLQEEIDEYNQTTQVDNLL
jgi:hypothetical protein